MDAAVAGLFPRRIWIWQIDPLEPTLQILRNVWDIPSRVPTRGQWHSWHGVSKGTLIGSFHGCLEVGNKCLRPTPTRFGRP